MQGDRPRRSARSATRRSGRDLNTEQGVPIIDAAAGWTADAGRLVGRVAAPPRVPRGNSVGPRLIVAFRERVRRRGAANADDAALLAALDRVRGDESWRRRGRDAERSCTAPESPDLPREEREVILMLKKIGRDAARRRNQERKRSSAPLHPAGLRRDAAAPRQRLGLGFDRLALRNVPLRGLLVERPPAVRAGSERRVGPRRRRRGHR